jgi:hypothetical protein
VRVRGAPRAAKTASAAERSEGVGDGKSDGTG